MRRGGTPVEQAACCRSELSAFSAEVPAGLRSYAKVSPSGTGLHINNSLTHRQPVEGLLAPGGHEGAPVNVVLVSAGVVGAGGAKHIAYDDSC